MNNITDVTTTTTTTMAPLPTTTSAVVTTTVTCMQITSKYCERFKDRYDELSQNSRSAGIAFAVVAPLFYGAVFYNLIRAALKCCDSYEGKTKAKLNVAYAVGNLAAAILTTYFASSLLFYDNEKIREECLYRT